MPKPIPTRFRPQDFESKWQSFWEKQGLYSPDFAKANRPYYNLMMFPYPSAEGLHVGNMYAFTGTDIHGRFMRMQGYDVFEPIGLDGFGIHSENYAMKVNRHPQEQAKISQSNFYRQLRAIGNSFDFRHTLETYDTDYYRWTQWLFIQMFKHGLAYRQKAMVNWCPGCKTVLADEQVIDGECERCTSAVEKKDLEQWFFRITAYADKLLQNTYKPHFNWPEKVKIGQQNWIGKKEGININYPIIKLSSSQEDTNHEKYEVTVFTTRPDTNFGATFIVLAPEHPLALKITDPEHQESVKKYIETTHKKSKADRISEGRKKTGVFTGAYAVNQLTARQMPVWIADFVLMEFGTGAVVGVPGHDKRDFEFAREYGLPVIRVVVGKDGDTKDIKRIEQVQESDGTMVNSGFLNGIDILTATQKMMDYMEEKGWGKRVTTYHLRDWLISRQRYWGAPIPMIYCEKCAGEGKSWFTTEESDDLLKSHRSPKESVAGWYPVPEFGLPVLLPNVKDWRPTGSGRGPLAAYPEFYRTKCPACGQPAVRETDVCDTFLDSAWYYLRYPFTQIQNSKQYVIAGNEEIKQSLLDNKINNEIASPSFNRVRNDNGLPWDNGIAPRWFPVNSYIGGAEHTVLHLLYTRFVYMALIDWGLLKVARPQNDEFIANEPFRRFYAHGLIIKDGVKMSKSKGNVVVPDEYIRLYGADTLRTYLMFLGPFNQGGDFRDTGIAGMYKWLSRVWRLVSEFAKNKTSENHPASQEALKSFNKTVSAVTREMQNLRYNTAIARLMEFTNWWQDHPQEINLNISKGFIKMLAPFAPFMTEELYQNLSDTTGDGKQDFCSIHTSAWPKPDERYLGEDTVTLVVQVNGKVRDTLVLPIQTALDQSVVEQLVRGSDNVNKWLQNKQIKKIVFVPRRLINFVV